MNVFALLQRDHTKVSSLFQKIKSGFGQRDAPERHHLFRQIKQELELHAEVEDLHVYRVFQQAEATRDDAAQALEAHRKIKTLLDELNAAQGYDQTWVSKFQDLQKLVEHYVAAEENERFRKAKSIMTPQEAEELGVKVDTAKHAISRNAPATEGGTPERT
jgi:hemerythrin HHE cation binding domain-containing protein